MPSKKDNTYQHAEIILDRMIKISGLSQTQFAKSILEIKGANISGARKSGKIPDRWFEIVQEKFGVSRAELCKPPNPAVSNGGVILGGDVWQKRRASDHQPTATQENLRWIVEWMNKYYGEHPSKSMYLYEDLKERYPSFSEFVEKKRASGDHQAGLPGEQLVNDKG